MLFATSLALFALGVRAFGDLQDARASTSTFALSGAGIAQDDAEEVRQAVLALECAGDVVLWSQNDGQTVFGDNAAAAADVAVVDYVGDVGLLLPNLAARPTDPGTCVLSSAASERLFATVEATGRSVRFEGAALRVVDMVPSSASFLVKEGRATSDAEAAPAAGQTIANGTPAAGAKPPCTRITTRARDADGFPLTAGLLAPALGANVQELDYGGLALLAHGCLFLHPLALALALVLTGCRTALDERMPAAPAERVVCAATAIGGAVGATIAFASTLTAFGGYYPTRWSDFPAWQEAADAWTGGLAHLAFARQTVFDQPAAIAGAAAVAFAAFALMALLAAFWQLRQKSTVRQAKHTRKQVR